MRPRMRRPVHSLLFAACLGVPAASAATVLDELALARALICSLRKSGPARVPPPLQARDDDLMVIIEGIGVDQGTANVTSSRAVGAKPARGYASDTPLHIIEYL